MSDAGDDRPTDAGLCRANGWKVGDILEGVEGHIAHRIRLTAIGEDDILAKVVAVRRHGMAWDDHREREHSWTLFCREWVKVGSITTCCNLCNDPHCDGLACTGLGD